MKKRNCLILLVALFLVSMAACNKTTKVTSTTDLVTDTTHVETVVCLCKKA